jgi:hypothetical protein
LILIKLLSIKQVARLIKVRLNDFPIAIPWSPSHFGGRELGFQLFRAECESLEARCTNWSRKFELVMWRWHMRKDWFGSLFLADTLALACLFAFVAFATFW